MLVAIGLGFLLALVFGGRFRNLGERTLRSWFLLPLGLALQLTAIESHGDTWPFLLVLLSYAFLFAFAVANVSVTGFWMILLGVTLNALAIGLNHGMPVSHDALDHTGRHAGVFAAESHAHRSSDKALFLGDVVPVTPLGEVVSFGDLVLGVGLVDVIIHLMRPARRRREEDEDDTALLPLLVDDVVHS